MLEHSQTTLRTVARDLAISAVASDSAFVTELMAEIGKRLERSASSHASMQATSEPDATTELVPFVSTTTRMVLVVYHHLWLHDEATQRWDTARNLRRKARRQQQTCRR